MDEGPDYTLEEIGAQVGVSREGVRQFEPEDLRRFRRPTRTKL